MQRILPIKVVTDAEAIVPIIVRMIVREHVRRVVPVAPEVAPAIALGDADRNARGAAKIHA